MFGYVGSEIIENISEIADKIEVYAHLKVFAKSFCEANSEENIYGALAASVINMTENDDEFLKYGAGLAQIGSDFRNNNKEYIEEKYIDGGYTECLDNLGDSEDIQDGIDEKRKRDEK